MVGANAGLIGMSKEHLAIALALGVPVCVVISKVRAEHHSSGLCELNVFTQIDMAPVTVFEDTIKQVRKILKSPGCR
jgi:GTPase